MPRARRLALLGLAMVAGAVLASTLVLALELWAARHVSLLGSNVASTYRLNHSWRPYGSRLHREWVRDNPDFPEPYLHVYNDRGWLETYDVSPAKDDGTFRIFYVGDSFIEGTAPMEESVPSRVESRLNELATGKDVRFEVVNTGTSSYSPTIHYILTRYVIMQYDPDLIVVNVDMTDDFDDWKYSDTLVRDAAGDPWAAPPRSIYTEPFIYTSRGAVEATLRLRIELWLLQHSHVYNWIRERVEPRGTASPLESTAGQDRLPFVPYQQFAWCADVWDAPTRQQVDHTLDLVERLMRFAQREGVRIMYTSVPHYSQYAGEPDGTGPPSCSARPHTEIAALAQAQGVPYLDSHAALSDRIRGQPQDLYYYSGDVHFNPRGYEIWAAAHLTFLMDESMDLLPRAFFRD